MGNRGLELRIGINSGPVVAGVIGRKRFLYDLWGDAVNVADRMQTHGTPGRIQVTRATYELLKDEFVLEPRGMIEVRGKGEMETWYLVGRRDLAGIPTPRD
jgi:class 3 adenylate cyclase